MPQISSTVSAKALDVWTVKDPEKFKKAEENNLNYIVYYSEDELYKD